jgi:molybdenum cofactor synthesis domain-containing protein
VAGDVAAHGSSLPSAVLDRYRDAVTPLEDAQSFVIGTCPVLAPLDVPFTGAEGLVLAADVVAAEQVPPFDNSAVDGYAVRAADIRDTPIELPVVAEVAAGASTDHVMQPGEAIRIMTGAPLPAGADAVVMVEETERVGDDRVRINAGVGPGTAVRHAGDDVQPGDLLFPAGTFVTPAIVGVLASINATTVSAFPRARVAVLSTGDELVEDGRPLAPGEIRESNRKMLSGLLRDAGCDVVDMGTVRDDEDALEVVLRQAADECDAIVSSGGVSMGDYDVVKAVLGRIAEMTWMQIAIKPAKPFAFGMLDGTPVFGLPGNPVSSIVSFEMLARPALRRMMGHRRLARQSIVAIADDDLSRRPDGKVHLMRVLAEFGDDGRCHVRSARAQGSHQLAATALANAIAVVPDGEGLPAGSEVAIVMMQGSALG